MNGRLAVIVPVRNGGELLQSTVQSCGISGISGAEAEVLVLNNCSDDGACEKLPASVGRGIPVRVLNNERDLGRVGNWNRGVQAAHERGFEFAGFLFAGDTWMRGDAAPRLLALMQSSGADLGMAQYFIVDGEGCVMRRSTRVSFRGETKVAPSTSFLQAMMRRGHMPITPLQANFYRLRGGSLPRFDEGRPLTTDLDATLEFLARSGNPVALIAKPLCAWLARKGRVFCESGLEPFMADHFRQLRFAEELTGIRVDWSRAKSVFLLGCARAAMTFGGWRSLPRVLRSALTHVSAQPGAINPVDMAALVARHMAASRSSLHLG